MSRHRNLMLVGVFVVLILAALACTCGPLSQVTSAQATISAAATQVNEVAPTFEALASQAPELQLTANAALGTAEALGTSMPGGVPGGVPGASQNCGPDGGDGYSTTGCYTISVGSSGTGTLNSLLEAHNWSFQGTGGQSITVRASGQGDCDPRVKLIDSSGNVLAEDDDSGGGPNGRDALFTATLPSNGTYYLRVDIFQPGTYTLAVN